MLLGMTRGEIILVVFIFALVYGAGFLPRLGEWVGMLLFGGNAAAKAAASGTSATAQKRDSKGNGDVS